MLQSILIRFEGFKVGVELQRFGNLYIRVLCRNKHVYISVIGPLMCSRKKNSKDILRQNLNKIVWDI